MFFFQFMILPQNNFILSMNILLLHQYFLEDNDAGGSRWNEMAKVWIEQGHSVTVIAGTINYSASEIPKEYKNKLFSKKMQGDVAVFRSYVYSGYNSNFIGRLFGYFSFVFSSLFVGLFIARKKYDFVVVTSPPLFIGISGYLISFFKRIPFVFEIRDLWPESAIDTGIVTNKCIIKLAYLLEQFIYNKATLINVLTPAFRDVLIVKKNINPDKIIYIPNAADFSISDNYLETFDVNQFKKDNNFENKFIITYVGAHGVANHLEQVLETAALMSDYNVLFLLIGQGMEKNRLKSIANKLQLNNVIFIDPVPKAEIFKYILASDVGCSVLKNVATFKTVYSNKTFDYMSCKKPVLMAIDGVSRALIEESNAGLYVQPENPQDFKENILFYMNNTSILNEHGKNGYIFAKSNFDRTKLAEKYINIINSILYL
jgi:glycosyltransferase involved in cell wall biosynthesis